MHTIILRLSVESDAAESDLREAICSCVAGMEDHYISHEVMPDKSEVLRADVKFRIAIAESGNCKVNSGITCSTH